MYTTAKNHQQHNHPNFKVPNWGYYSIVRYDCDDAISTIEETMTEAQKREIAYSWAKSKNYSVLADNGMSILVYDQSGNCFTGLPAHRNW